MLGNIWTIYWFAFWKPFTCLVCLFWYRTLCVRHSCTRQWANCWWQNLVLPNSFPAKITLTQVLMQTLANFALCRAQIGPCWPILPLSGRLARFPLPRATRCNEHQSQENRVVFWICKWWYTSTQKSVGSHRQWFMLFTRQRFFD